MSGSGSYSVLSIDWHLMTQSGIPCAGRERKSHVGRRGRSSVGVSKARKVGIRRRRGGVSVSKVSTAALGSGGPMRP
jgi:hypothetical protein